MDNIIDNIITFANNRLNTEQSTDIYKWYRITGSHNDMLNYLKERAQQKDPVNVPVLPFIWIPDTFTEESAKNGEPYDIKVDNLQLFFIYANDNNSMNYERRKNENIDVNIIPFVNAFLDSAIYVPNLSKVKQPNVFEHTIEYHANFGAKLYDKNSLLKNTDAIQLNLNTFASINNNNCV